MLIFVADASWASILLAGLADGLVFIDRTDAKSIVAPIMRIRLLMVYGVQTLVSLDYNVLEFRVFIAEKVAVRFNCHWIPLDLTVNKFS
jgi:hypothetical protein